MFCKLISYCLNGLETIPVDIEVDISDGLPSFDIVGLPDCAVKESKERVKSAIRNSGFHFPVKKITINLAPADLKKQGSLYDLPIALGILCCANIIPIDTLQDKVFMGELALDGSLRDIRNIITFITALSSSNTTHYILPLDNASDLKLIESNTLFYANSLNDVVAYLNNQIELTHQQASCSLFSPLESPLDFKDVKGQKDAKQALLIAAAGYHNVLLIGPPGSGKTMLAKRLPFILPALTLKESLELTKLYTLANQLPDSKIISTRPFRAPHHTASPVALIGGGRHAQPGEVSLAHHGILFLDELLEFNKKTLEVLRQPLELGTTTVCRAKQTVTYPSSFLFIASTNPCPCGYYPNTKKCTCDIPSVRRYLQKLSGPMLDRIDLQIETQSISTDTLYQDDDLDTATMSALVQEAFNLQEYRYKDEDFCFNSAIPDRKLTQFCQLTPSAQTLLDEWFENNAVSMRSYTRVLKVARTIADLSHADKIEDHHVIETIGYRLLDHSFWN